MEEEADVFAVNYLRWTGRSQSDLQNALVNLIRADRSPSHDAEECLEAYDNHWQLNGHPYHMLPVDFKDDHHDFCYRLHSLDNIYPLLGAYPQAATSEDSGDYLPVREKFAEISAALAGVRAN